MPQIVTFDPDTLTINEVNTGLEVNETDLVEIYSEWKDWMLADSSRLGYPAAFRQVGSDPISDIQNLGTTFFLGGGWKFRPAEYDHQWIVNGNLFTDPAGLRRTKPTLGGYTVEMTYFVSNLVDSSVARLDLNQLLAAVYVDYTNGSPGTGDENGTPTNPVNNNADAFTILAARNLNEFRINGGFDLDRDATNLTFTGLGNHLHNDFTLGGWNVDRSLFQRLNLSGTMQGRIEANNCGLNVLSGLDGVFCCCGLIDDFTLADDSNSILRDCYSEVAGVATISITFGTNSMLQMRNYSGGVELEAYDATNLASIDLDPGHLIINANCTAGIVLVRGIGRCTRNDANTITLTDAGLLYGGQIVLAAEDDAPELLKQQLPK